MTRGNQREKAREKNLKEQAGSVGLTVTQGLDQKDRHHTFQDLALHCNPCFR